VPNSLSNDEWVELVDTPTTYERERYLRSLYDTERVREHIDEKNAEWRRLYAIVSPL